MSLNRPERPVEPYIWDKEHMDDDMLAEWHAYINALEDYIEKLENDLRNKEDTLYRLM